MAAPHGQRDCGAFHGRRVLLPQLGQSHTCFLPDRLPRLAVGSSSTSTMSIAKSTTGALLIAVPTPYPTTYGL